MLTFCTLGFTLHADAKHLDIVAEQEFSRFVDFFHSKVLISIVVAEWTSYNGDWAESQCVIYVLFLLHRSVLKGMGRAILVADGEDIAQVISL